MREKREQFMLNASFAVALAIVALTVFLVPRFIESPPNERIPRYQADMRSLAVALDSYYVDCKSYPEMMPLAVFGAIPASKIHAWTPTTFATGGAGLRGLTTPVAYLTSIYADAYIKTPLMPYAYYNDGKGGWIVISPGPDGDYDVDPTVEYDSTKKVPSDALLRHTYDPSNGSSSGGWTKSSWISDGDVYRIKN